jgi:NAD(P)-dependent dehydrogenase (short-subunit alcohol dehydrogenase family)
MAHRSLQQKHVVITGGSDGIGRALALDVARRGARVTLAARSAENLRAVAEEITRAGGHALAVPTDVTSEASCRALVAGAAERFGDVDVLVCNAGVGAAAKGGGPVDVDAIRRTMEVNFMGAVHATAAVLPSLRRTHGLIVAVSSWQGLFAFPGSAGYAASKHAMQGFYDSLRLDLRGAVDVLVVSPGPVATGIHFTDPAKAKNLTMARVEKQCMPVAECAALIRGAIESGRRDLVMTRTGQLAARLYPFFPGFVDEQIVRAARRFYS